MPYRPFALCVIVLLALMGLGVSLSAQESDLPPIMYLSLHYNNSDIEIDRLSVQSKRVLRLRPIDNQYYTQGPQWSPDGTWITYTANRTDVTTPDVWIMDSGGGKARVLVKESRSHSWAPDSQHIAYEGLTDEGTPAIYTMALDGSDERLVAENADLPVWSPEGVQIAYRDHNDVVSVVSVDGTAPKRLFERTEEMAGDLEWLSWSPDGTRIAFLLSALRPEDSLPVSTLYTIRPDGTDLMRLTDTIHNPGIYYQWKPYDWSPDSTQIAFVSGWYDAGLYTVNADGTNEQKIVAGDFETLTSDKFGEFQSLDWSPDGQWIAFSSPRYLRDNVWMVRPDGTDLRQLTHGDSNAIEIFPEWRPGE